MLLYIENAIQKPLARQFPSPSKSLETKLCLHLQDEEDNYFLILNQRKEEFVQNAHQPPQLELETYSTIHLE